MNKKYIRTPGDFAALYVMALGFILLLCAILGQLR